MLILNPMKTLIIADVQNNFLKNGSLAVPNGNDVIPVINKIQNDFALIVATKSSIRKIIKALRRNVPEKIDLKSTSSYINN